jgi:hypothetical protein
MYIYSLQTKWGFKKNLNVDLHYHHFISCGREKHCCWYSVIKKSANQQTTEITDSVFQFRLHWIQYSTCPTDTSNHFHAQTWRQVYLVHQVTYTWIYSSNYLAPHSDIFMAQTKANRLGPYRQISFTRSAKWNSSDFSTARRLNTWHETRNKILVQSINYTSNICNAIKRNTFKKNKIPTLPVWRRARIFPP